MGRLFPNTFNQSACRAGLALSRDALPGQSPASPEIMSEKHARAHAVHFCAQCHHHKLFSLFFSQQCHHLAVTVCSAVHTLWESLFPFFRKHLEPSEHLPFCAYLEKCSKNKKQNQLNQSTYVRRICKCVQRLSKFRHVNAHKLLSFDL